MLHDLLHDDAPPPLPCVPAESNSSAKTKTVVKGATTGSVNPPPRGALAPAQRANLMRGLDVLVAAYMDLARSDASYYYAPPRGVKPPYNLVDLHAKQSFTPSASMFSSDHHASSTSSSGSGSARGARGSSSSSGGGSGGGRGLPFHQCLTAHLSAQKRESNAAAAAADKTKAALGANGHSRPSGAEVLATAQLSVPAVPTCPPRPHPLGDYSKNTVRVTGFEPTFELTDSGLHRPFVVHCRGSDGVLHKQLVKGNDDVRQDMVMMQVQGRMKTVS